MMKRSIQSRVPCGTPAVAFVLLATGVTRAAPVVWDVDPSVSYIRLTIPDQAVDVTDAVTVTVRLRDAGSNSQWTDAGGRRAALDGQINTDYVNFTSIEFVGGSSDLRALQQTNLRPNPVQWDPVAEEYTATGTAPAALGARVRGTYIIVTFDAAFMAFRDLSLDVASGVVPLDHAGKFSGGQTQFGIASAVIDVDGLELPIPGLGQPIPDLLQEPVPAIQDVNAGGGVIENLGGRNRKLTYTVDVSVVLQLDTVVVTGSASGKIVAYGTIPPLSIPFDFEGDGDVDLVDEGVFQACATGPAIMGPPPGCTPEQFAVCDADDDRDVDQADFGGFQRCYSGENTAAQPSCAE